MYDKRPCRDEGFVRDKVYGLYVEKASAVTVDGLTVQAAPGIDYGGERN